MKNKKIRFAWKSLAFGLVIRPEPERAWGKLLIAVWSARPGQGTAERRVCALAERLFNITSNYITSFAR